MNIASFVAPEDFCILLKYLIDFHEGTMKSSTSVFVILGDDCSGKSTLTRLIKLLCPKNSAGNLDHRAFMAFPNVQYTSMTGFKKDVVFCSPTPNSDHNYKIINARIHRFHRSINAVGGITCRELHKLEERVDDPAVLVVERAKYIQRKYDLSEENFKGNKSGKIRKIQTIELPYKFNSGTYFGDIATLCHKEVTEIMRVLKLHNLWLKISMFLDDIGTKAELPSDIRYYFFDSIFMGTCVSSYYWKLIFETHIRFL